MPENFDLHEVSKRRRVDGDEGGDLCACYRICSWLRFIEARNRLICAKKRNANVSQAQGNQAEQHKHLVSFRSQTWSLRTLGIPYQYFNSLA